MRSERVGYYDSGGSLFLPAGNIYVCVDKPPPKSLSRSICSMFLDRRAPVLHAVLLRHREWFGVIDIANQAQVSPATASQVLMEMEKFERVVSRGQGPGKERCLQQPGALLDAWVNQQARCPCGAVSCRRRARKGWWRSSPRSAQRARPGTRSLTRRQGNGTRHVCQPSFRCVAGCWTARQQIGLLAHWMLASWIKARTLRSSTQDRWANCCFASPKNGVWLASTVQVRAQRGSSQGNGQAPAAARKDRLLIRWL